MTRQLPLTVGALAAIAVTVMIIAGGYFGLVAPRRREITRLEAQLSAALSQTAAAEAVAPITEAERARWREVEARVRERFVSPEDQLRLVLEVGQVARAAGLSVTDLRLESTAGGAGTAVGVAPVALPSAAPRNFTVNSGVISLSARHGYRDLIDFLDRVIRGNRYVALASLDIRRVEGHLESDIRLVSLGWIAGRTGP